MSQGDVIVHIVEQHAEEAAFLWTQRDRAVTATNYTLKDLARLDERVEAHLDGLRIAGQAGWDICKETAEAGEAGAIFALAGLAFENNDPQKIKEVLALGCAKPTLERQVISALGWLEFERAKPILSDLVKNPDPKVRRIAIAGFAVHRQDPGPALIEAMSDPDNRLRARAILAVAELGRRDLASYIRSPKTQPNEDTQFAAAWALARFGWPDEVLKTIAEGGGKYALRALEIAMRTMELGSAKAWCSSLLNRNETLRFGVIGAGIIGDPEAIERLILLMRNEKLARLAGESFSLITGSDLTRDGLEGTAPAGFVSGPSDNAESDDVSIDPDEDLAWPNADRIEEWWKNNAKAFRAGVRHFHGEEITYDSLDHALASETQRYRSTTALELAVRKPSNTIIEIRRRG